MDNICICGHPKDMHGPDGCSGMCSTGQCFCIDFEDRDEVEFDEDYYQEEYDQSHEYPDEEQWDDEDDEEVDEEEDPDEYFGDPSDIR